jgi:hypothetical protein
MSRRRRCATRALELNGVWVACLGFVQSASRQRLHESHFARRLVDQKATPPAIKTFMP